MSFERPWTEVCAVAEREPRSVVDGAFRVLRALPGSGREHQVATIAGATGLPRPTVHRLLRQLREAGAVELQNGHWHLAASLLGLAQQVEPLTGLRGTASRVMAELREQTGAAVSFVVPSEDSFVALEMLPGRDTLPIDARSGAQMPASTAAAMVLTPGRIPTARRRSFGAAVDDEAVLPGLTCYAVPVVLPRGRRASLQVATAAHHPAERLAAPVHHAAAALEQALVRSADNA
ncbi:helix-turn-helix domain-containing protein [Kineosporia sp. NBRC 101731]|uniref:helix-turn-helix domain-containing protein n=1 Tax=Kineosporia sp. NBRC 101731 TaxID=3032199 RepID=UPI002552B445|nr:helix-turn-helix domain-containing protein [Kineosporia sp. NBRC 101731]